MPRYDFTSQRLFLDHPLKAGEHIDLDRQQANYLINVLRLKDGAPVLVFNGLDGEWQAQLEIGGRKKAALRIDHATRDQTPPYDLHYLFAPLKQARLEYMVQKAVEMGVGELQPVITQHTQSRNLNMDRMNAYVIEAAEQCGILNIASVHQPITMAALIQDFPENRHLIFCDESEEGHNPLELLKSLKPKPVSVLIGPEGGFSEEERAALRALPQVQPIPLGPRILRADTAAVAALAMIQATVGDWLP